MNCGKIQYHAGEILAKAKKIAPKQAYCTICILNEDLYPWESWNFVFGLADLSAWIGVFSFAWYHPDFDGEEHLYEGSIEDITTSLNIIMIFWSTKVMCHEIGHMFGLKHCTYYKCLMNGSMSSEEGSRKPAYLCIICLKKLF